MKLKRQSSAAVRSVCSTAIAALAAAALLPALMPGTAAAVFCPGGGAKVEVCVTNPTGTTTPMITVSGHNAVGQLTCSGPAPMGASYSTTLTVGPNQTACTAPVPSGGLYSGVYVHEILVSGTTQEQFQKKPVLFSTSDLTRVEWTYMPNVITVNATGGGGLGSCPINAASNPPTCDIRKAVGVANGLAGTEPVLIQIKTSPNFVGAPNLVLSRQNLTVDGTHESGNPWIVADPNAAAAGTQDPFPHVVEFPNSNGVRITASDITLKGLEIRQFQEDGDATSVASLIVQTAPVTGTRLDSVRLDAGTVADCAGFLVDCETEVSLVTLLARTGPPASATMTMFNVEGHSAVNHGLHVMKHHNVEVRKSWLHNNYHDNVDLNASLLQLENSVIERAGMRVTDDKSMIGTARGVRVQNDLGVGGTSTVSLNANVIRNNRSTGLSATGFGDVFPQDDSFCGNGGTGLTTGAQAGFIPTLFGQGGVGATYNAGHGARVAQDDFTAANINDDSAFASNGLCGLFNEWPFDALGARSNQWRGGDPPPDTCIGEPGAGPVDFSDRQDPNGLITLQTPYPSNVFLKGQTVQILGSGFNAITGNPLAEETAGEGECEVGVEASGASPGQPDSCCNKVERANSCAATNQPIDGGGNCVELRAGSTGIWVVAPVKAVTPRMIEAQVPVNVFTCLGGSGEKVRVSKKTGVVERFAETGYCTNQNPL
jgi:hypothetical protein